jgi:hypothetical protein
MTRFLVVFAILFLNGSCFPYRRGQDCIPNNILDKNIDF